MTIDWHALGTVFAVTLLATAAGGLLSPGLSLVDDAIWKRFPPSAEEAEIQRGGEE